jgi:sugar/nucleoside kinase (ribokinase family)
MAFANAYAGISTTKLGAASAMPLREEVDAFMASEEDPENVCTIA